MATIKTYSVLLARPDYIADGPTDTYWTSFAAASPELAVRYARIEAAGCDGIEEGDLDDYAVLLVIEGKHQDLNPER